MEESKTTSTSEELEIFPGIEIEHNLFSSQNLEATSTGLKRTDSIHPHHETQINITLERLFEASETPQQNILSILTLGEYLRKSWDLIDGRIDLTPLTPTTPASPSFTAVNTTMATAVTTEQSFSSLKEEQVDRIFKCLRYYLAYSVSEVRAAALSVVGLMIKRLDTTGIKLLFRANFHIFLVRSLSKDHRFELEREQALRCFRSIMDQLGGRLVLSNWLRRKLQACVRVIVSIAEQSTDTFRNICLQTLCELAVKQVDLLVKCSGIRVLLHAMVEGSGLASESATSAFLYVLDASTTRKYIRPEVDIEYLICNFTDTYNKGNTAADRIKQCANTLKNFLTSWTGLIYLCSNHRRSILSIVTALGSPVKATQLSLLNLLNELFHVTTSVDGLESLNDHFVHREMFFSKERIIRPTFNDRSDLIDQYVSVLLLVFVDSGLLEALVDLVENNDQIVSSQGSKLLARIVKLSLFFLPSSHVAKITTLPRLFELAVYFQKLPHRFNAISALARIDDESLKHIFVPSSSKREKQTLPFAPSFHQQLPQSQLSASVDNLDAPVDETQVRLLIQETMVMAERDSGRWNWDLIQELFLTSLKQPAILNDTLRNTAFVKRVLSFYRPVSLQFSDLLMDADNIRFLTIGCEIVNTMTGCMEGTKYLYESGLFKEISQFLLQEEQNLNKDRMTRSLVWGYFWILMTASKTKEGLRLLEKSNAFDAFFKLAELRDRNDIHKEILFSMDYQIDGYPRLILSKMLSVESKEVRLLALHQLRILLHHRLSSFKDWGMRMLVDQLYDLEPEICQLAVETLDEACDNPECLDMLLKLRPVLDHLGEIAKPIFLRFLSSNQGFQNILDMDFVHDEMESWMEYQNVEYVAHVENSLMGGLENLSSTDETEQEDDQMSKKQKLRNQHRERYCYLPEFRVEGIVTPHLYGALAKTTIGCETIKTRGHLERFAQVIRSASEYNTAAQLLELKAVLWAVGHIGSTELGIRLLEEEKLVQEIITLAGSFEYLSIKGTCYYVLGLIARTLDGNDVLNSHGWITNIFNEASNMSETTLRGNNQSVVCIPEDVEMFFSLPTWTFVPPSQLEPFSKSPSVNDPIKKVILETASKLGNLLLANAAYKVLVKLKSEHPRYFKKDLQLYVQLHQMFGAYHFRVSARKFLLDLFEIQFSYEVLEKIDEIIDSQDLLEEISAETTAILTRATTMTTEGGGDRTISSSPEAIGEALKQDESGSSDEQTSRRDSASALPKERLLPMVVVKGFLL